MGDGGFLGRHGYAYDVFMSYAHGDARNAGTSQLKRWSHQFRDLLCETLDSYGLKPPVRIFLDESDNPDDALDRAAELGPELDAIVSSSALLQVMMTPHYLDSRWCARELATWVQTSSQRSGSSDRRITVARVRDTGSANWPAALCDEQGEQLPGWRFHGGNEDFPPGWAKDWKNCVPDGMEDSFLKFASFLCRRLKELDEELEQRARQAALVAGLGEGKFERIYLYGREDERDAWASVYDDLDRIGVMVSPGEPEPLDADDDSRKREAYARMASRCEAMVMVGNDPIKLDCDLDVIGHERRQFIWSKYKKYLPCAVVDRNGALGQDWRIRNAQRRKIDWLRTDDCDWPGCIQTWLKGSAREVADRYGIQER